MRRRSLSALSDAYDSDVSLETRVVLSSICAFNAIVMVVLAAVSLEYVDGGARVVGAVFFLVGSAVLFGASHALRPYRNE